MKSTRLSLPSLPRRRFLRQLGLMGLSPWLASCGLAPPALRIAAGSWQGYETVFLAQRQGWLDPAQVQIKEFPSSAGCQRALEAGIVDGATLTLDETLRLRNRGLGLSLVLVFDISLGADMLLARPAIQQLGQLRGRRIGRAEGTYADLFLALALEQAGLEVSDIIPLNLAHGDQLHAWRQDRVDALISYNPVAAQLRQLGAEVLFDSSQTPNAIVDVLALRTDLLQNADRAPAIKALLAGHFRVLELQREAPQEAARLMADHLNLSPAEVLASFRGLQQPDLAANRKLLQPHKGDLLLSAQHLLSLMLKNRLLRHPDDLRNLVSDRFLLAP
jgi:NitT/TauT family transport system substrate-binding protein